MGPISQHKSKKRTFSKIYQSLGWTILHCETRIKQHLQNHPSLKQQSSEITHTCKQAKTLQQPCPSSTFRPATRCWNHWRHESTTWQLCLWTARQPKQRCHSTGDQPATPTQANNTGAQNPVPPDAPQGENSSQPLSSQPETHPPDALNGEDTQPTPSQTSDDNIGYVEQLLTYKYINGKKYFQLKWIGHSERTWEPEDNINPTLIQEFHIDRTQKGKARKRK